MSQPRRSQDPIAIVGIGCRFPGGVKDPESFWNLLCNGIDAIRDMPANRWDIRRFYDPNPRKPGKMYIKQAGYLTEDYEYFDPMFFGISPREAECLDPQQRLLLEVAWEAIEDAGFDLNHLRGAGVGVFMGGFCLDSMATQFDSQNRHLINSSTSTSTAMALLANRISYVFDFRGPSVAMDTACSSSLVACHFACQSLWNGESSIAMVGGVNIMMRPEFPIVMSKGQFLSKQGRCKTFDEQADGYIRGEGAGIVILKSLKQALVDNDRIYATIRASGINQDGHTPGMTLPNRESQVQLIQEVYSSVGVSPKEIQYVEAHGTGTKAGDTTEALALHAVLSEGRSPDEKCFVGSVKTNIGHLEAAAGIAGLIKTALCLRYKKIPANLHFNTPNPDIPFDRLCIKVPTQLTSFPSEANEQLYVGVNSFGYGGTNAHILLEAKPEGRPTKVARRVTKPRYRLVPISARSEDALKNLAQSYYDFIRSGDGRDVDLDALVFTLARRRTHHSHRLALVVESKEELVEKLSLFINDELTHGMSIGKDSQTPPGLVFVYTGMGPQSWGMGRDLLKNETVFRKAFKKCDAVFKKISGWSILSELNTDKASSRLNNVCVSQPINLAIQISLTELWKSWGVFPDAAVGHSVGEVAAAYVSGSLAFEDAFRLTYHRSDLQQTVAGRGAMLAVAAKESECKTLINGYKHVSIAAINSPNSMTITGEPEEVSQIARTLESKQVFAKQLRVDVAYHSYQMDVLKSEFLKALGDIGPCKPKLPLYSTVTGKAVSNGLMNSRYWWRNVRQPVLFEQAVAAMIKDGYRDFIEIGPHPVLSSYIKECLFATNNDGRTFGSLNRGQEDQLSMLESLGNLFTKGYAINWEAITPDGNYSISLPTYPWQRERYWLESSASVQDRLGRPGNVFLNEDKFMPDPTWEVDLNGLFFPYLPDHRLNDAVVFPAACYVEAGLAIQRQLTGHRVCLLEDIQFKNLLVYEADGVQKLQSRFDPLSQSYSVYCKKVEEHSDWTLHATGRILPSTSISTRKIDVCFETFEEVSVDRLYQAYEQLGLIYGSHFKRVTNLWRNRNEVLGKIQKHPSLRNHDGQEILHPTLLDACFQTLLGASLSDTHNLDHVFIPFSIKELWCFANKYDSIWCYGKITKRYDDEIYGDLVLFDDDQNVIAEVSEIGFKALTTAESRSHGLLTNHLYELKWKSTSELAPGPATACGDWYIFDTSDNWTNDFIECCPADDVRIVRVNAGCTFERSGDDSVTIRAMDAKDMAHVFEHSHDEKRKTIVYLWSLRPTASNGDVQAAIDHCVPLLHLAQKTSQSQQPTTLIIVTRKAQAALVEDCVEGVQSASLWGLGRVLTNEHPNIKCKLVDLDSHKCPQTVECLFKEIVSKDDDTEVAIRGGSRWVNRLTRLHWNYENDNKVLTTLPSEGSFTLDLDRPGNLETLHYRETSRRAPKRNEVEIQVHVTGLNFKDLLKCYGRLPRLITENTYTGDARGMECSGTVVRKGSAVKHFEIGDHVIAAFPGTFSSYITMPTSFIMRKPEILPFEKSPIMIGFITACYCLMDVARLQKNEKVLIHNASGGVGLAAIQVAKQIGAEIYATAGSDDKRNYLRSLGIKYIYNSRTLEFAEQIKKDTQGYGVDAIIGAVSGNSLQKGFSLLAPYGRYLELGKKDIAENNSLRMLRFNENVSFYGIDIDRVMLDRPQVIRRVFRKIKRGFEEGYYHPIPVTVFPASDVHKAFHYMATSRHIGKIVIRMNGEQVPIRIARSQDEGLKQNGTYIVSGGTRGLGLAISQWLAEKKVRQLVLVSRNGVNSELTQDTIAAIQEKGTAVYRASVDITSEEQVAKLFTHVNSSMPPVRGVFHCAAVVDDGLLVNLDKSRFETVMAPKVRGTMLLHQYTKDLDLDFFVSSSSISSLIGNPGQANYAAGNAFLDAFAHFSRARGKPATTINWGIFSDQGVVARNGELKRLLQNMGIRAFNNADIFRILEAILHKKPTQIGAFEVDWRKWASLGSGKPRSSLFFDLVESCGKEVSETHKRFLETMSKLDSQQQHDYLLQQFKMHIGKVLRFPTEKIDVHCSIEAMGIDSLMAAELRLIIIKEFGVELSAAELLQNITISQICGRILTRIKSKEPATYDSQNGAEQGNDNPSLPEASMSDFSVECDSEYASKSAMPAEIQESEKFIDTFKLYKPYISLRKRMIDLRKQAEKCGILDAESPYFRVHEGIMNHTTRILGDEYINFSSYNYLGLSGNPLVSKAAKEAISKFGTSVSASRMVSGERAIHTKLEKEIANMVGTESALAFVSGHATNVTTIGHLFGPNDIIVHDSLIHDSIVQGCLLAGAKRLSFAHNDPRALETLLENHRTGHERLLIVIEGIYSMDGDIPDLPRFIEIKKRYKGLLMVDEAHSIGVLGDRGFGIGEHYGISPDDVDIWMGTLSKSLASCGGYISGCSELVEYLKYTAPGFRYSVGLSPANAAAALKAVQILKNEPERVHRLRSRARLFSQLARERSLDTVHSVDSPILPIIIGNSEQTLRLAHQLFNHKINVQPILHPAVSENAARLRFFVSALHTEDQIRFTVDTLVEEMANVGI